LLRFGLVSGAGLAGDMILFALLRRAGMGNLAANAVSAGCAVAFVFFVSAHRVFFTPGRRLWAKFLVYLAYQALAVWLASLAVAFLAPRLPLPARWADTTWLAGIAAKALILPVTFYTNFVFMARLTTGRWRWK
jgi:putative flippase GtrA